MTTLELAQHLFDRAARDEQCAHRISPDDDIPAVRETIRRLARAASLRIRTAVIDGVLVVVRADAKIWTDPTNVMRSKLSAD